MLRLFFPYVRKLHRELTQERRHNKALQETCADLRNHQERSCSDLRHLREQIWHLEGKNNRAFALVTNLRKQLASMGAASPQRKRDEHGRFV
ncbi:MULTISPECIES: hypothetical protein [unclassified Saccharibacter]|uniref:hypothetical protein n=1 Tax=unclassified Saccharibacter TaxID=2648722 RepID=UPI001321D3BC|nr:MULTISPECIES: hypothetical protein [unclassified Saccharibacter]MXV35947.1 hypothetical protein [Saccharibacter sp. EH611]MXV58381.1 hypothetical protein [Saccharibacter sp. EH70]MXV65837.1 hypothetical protein [Saccharibacter sp. EH60]